MLGFNILEVVLVLLLAVLVTIQPASDAYLGSVNRRGSKNSFLNKTTIFVAVLFFINTIFLDLMHFRGDSLSRKIEREMAKNTESTPVVPFDEGNGTSS